MAVILFELQINVNVSLSLRRAYIAQNRAARRGQIVVEQTCNTVLGSFDRRKRVVKFAFLNVAEGERNRVADFPVKRLDFKKLLFNSK